MINYETLIPTSEARKAVTLRNASPKKTNHESLEQQAERTLEVIRGKWSMAVLCQLMTGTKRFNELSVNLGNIASTTLSENLRLLRSHGVIERVSYLEIPPRVEYSLTEKGRAMTAVIEALARWGAKHG
jgi:DNA-binding HxlR family transcriptional regulator